METETTARTSARIDGVRDVMRGRGADAALLTFLPDIRWACGFSGSSGVLIVREEDAHFVTDGRYLVQAQNEVKGAEVHVPGYKLYEHVAEQGLLRDGSSVVFQADHVSVAELEDLETKFPEVSFIPATELLIERVGRKDADEVARIRAAQRITDDVFEHLLNFLRAGLSEQEVATEIVYQHLNRGAEGMSFAPIVAGGRQGALPHARPTDRKLQKGDLVVIDMGCFLDGYASDMTRTVAIGQPDDEAKQVYELVLDAQKRAIDAARAGMTSVELDAVARRVIEHAGYGDFFSHGLGHGLGLQIHEWPRVSYHVDHLLPEGATVTIEPGVYVPERFGVRIEDIVVLRESGCENLTSARKDLVVL